MLSMTVAVAVAAAEADLAASTLVRLEGLGEGDHVATELAVDLTRFPELERWTRDDRQMYAELLVDTVVSTAAALLGDPAACRPCAR